MATIDWTGYGGVDAYLLRLVNPDPTSLLERWESILFEDNRRGVLAGQAGDGTRLPETTYRNSFTSSAPSSKAKPFAIRRLDLNAASLGSGDNLTSSQYRKLSGPPLAPRGERSRSVSNYKTRHGRTGSIAWAEGAWLNVLSKKGKPFLIAHFEGQGHLPKRDLRGLRPWGRGEARKALNTWMSETLVAQPAYFAKAGVNLNG